MRAGLVGVLVVSVLMAAGATRASAQVMDTATARSRAAARSDTIKKKGPTSTTRIPIKKEKPKPVATRIPPRVDTVTLQRVDTLRLVRVDTVFRVDTVNNCLGGFIPQDWVIPPVPIIPGSTVPPIGATTTPEPSSFALVASGLAGLLLLTRRRR